jgi:hypothetical protein
LKLVAVQCFEVRDIKRVVRNELGEEEKKGARQEGREVAWREGKN